MFHSGPLWARRALWVGIVAAAWLVETGSTATAIETRRGVELAVVAVFGAKMATGFAAAAAVNSVGKQAVEHYWAQKFAVAVYWPDSLMWLSESERFESPESIF